MGRIVYFRDYSYNILTSRVLLGLYIQISPPHCLREVPVVDEKLATYLGIFCLRFMIYESTMFGGTDNDVQLFQPSQSSSDFLIITCANV